MATEIRVPRLGESVAEATVARWLKRPGDRVAVDEPVVELETDKATLEVPAPAAGTLTEILAEEGATLAVGAVLCRIAEGVAATAPTPALAPHAGGPVPGSGEGGSRDGGEEREGAAALQRSGPAVRKLVAESGLDAAAIAATGPGGRISRADVARPLPVRRRPRPRRPPPHRLALPIAQAGPSRLAEREVRVPMTRLRRRIAERLKAAQNSAAMLTTFNEIDMSAVIALRERWRDAFEQKHGVRLGFMSVFVKAAITALKELPGVNAEIDGDDIVYKNHYDIGVAVASEQGLVVPVLRDADRMSFAEIETAIAGFREKGARRKAGDRRPRRRHLYDHERRRLRLAVVDADPQSAAIRHSRHAQDRAAAGGGPRVEPGDRRHRDPADDVCGANLRPPRRRRARGGDLPGARQGMRRRPGAPPL